MGSEHLQREQSINRALGKDIYNISFTCVSLFCRIPLVVYVSVVCAHLCLCRLNHDRMSTVLYCLSLFSTFNNDSKVYKTVK